MTIDPKAAELAKALADAVAAQNTQEYQERAKAAEENAVIDEAARVAEMNLEQYFGYKSGALTAPAIDHRLVELIKAY